MFSGHTASFKIGVSKVQDFENFELLTMYLTLFWALYTKNEVLKYLVSDDK